MEKIVGKYAHVKSENLDTFFKAVGVPYIPRKIMCSSNPTVEISKTEEGEWSITTITMFRTSTYKFRLNDEYEEHMPGHVIKCTTNFQDGKLTTDCRSLEGSDTTRIYECTDDGMTITYKYSGPEIEAVRHYKRI